MKILKLSLILCISATWLTAILAEENKPNYAEQLFWKVDPSKQCGGYYYESADIANTPNPPDIQAAAVNIRADSTLLAEPGKPSLLIGNVVATQPGRKITADRAYLYRDKETGKLTHIDLYGDVHLQEAGKLVVGQYGKLNLENGEITLDQGIYRFINTSAIGANTDAWGTVGLSRRLTNKIVVLKQATYSTCPPTTNTWKVKASTIKLNKESGRGQAFNARLYAKGAPVFYLPYFNFPITKDRKTGFLYPSFGITSQSGFNFVLPFYLNLAPNYDATITTNYYTKRGLTFDQLFRYLTTTSSGELAYNIALHDQVFQDFQQSAASEFGVSPLTQPALDRLDKDSATRQFVSWDDNTILDEHWSAGSNINWVSDDYYFQDYNLNYAMIAQDQLLNQVFANYQSTHWQFSTRLLGYQTLHPINENIITEQYRRLPEFDYSAEYPENKINFSLTGQEVNFDHQVDFYDDAKYPVGLRSHLFPMISYPKESQSFYIKPELGVDLRNYSLSNNTMAARDHLNPNLALFSLPTVGQNPDNNISSGLPVFDIDSGLNFIRSSSVFGKRYQQTLEPRLFYLYVPATNQDDIPLFDTFLPPFAFDTIFRRNRFAGIDRIGDANQLAGGITTRILDGDTGLQKFSASIGEIAYFKNRNVCLYANCIDSPDNTQALSPIAGQLTYNLTPAWYAVADGAWNPNDARPNNDSFDIYYLPGMNKSAHLGYSFVRGGDVINPTEPNDSENNLNRVNLGFQWPLSHHWNLLASWNYNISHSNPIGYFYGLQYDSCCWAIRVVASRALVAQNLNNGSDYRNSYYVQFLLKGLGSTGTGDANQLLQTNIPAYFDPFKG